jgi:hypothetical protein
MIFLKDGDENYESIIVRFSPDIRRLRFVKTGNTASSGEI